MNPDREPDREPDRVLIVRVGAMGDVLHALPAVAALRQRCPGMPIDWVVDQRWAALLVDGERPGPVISGVHCAATRLWSRSPFSAETLRSVATLRRAIRELRYGRVIDLQGTLRSAVLGRFARSPERFGFADPRERVARGFYNRPMPRRGRHVVSQNAALLEDALGLDLEPIAPTLPHSAAADAWAEQTLRGTPQRTALLTPTAGWAAKQWPIGEFATLARGLAEDGWTVLLNAASAADPVSRAVLEQAGGADQSAIRLVCPDVAGLVALTRRVGLVVGGDSGPVHLAAVVGTPVVALFGPTDPARNGPWGPGPIRTLRHPASRTSYKHVANVDAGLARLSVAEVLAAVAEVLAAASAKL